MLVLWAIPEKEVLMAILFVVLAGVYLISVVGAYKQTLPMYAGSLHSTEEDLPKVFRYILGFIVVFWPIVMFYTMLKVAFVGNS
jgi:hypothetical protein